MQFLNSSVILLAMASKRNSVIPASFLLIQRDNEVLLQRRFNTGFEDGNYTLISGHVDKGESPSQAVRREAKEEAGIEVKEEDLKFEQVLYRKGSEESHPERVDFFFSTEKWEGEPHITEPDKCDDLSWFPLSALPENTFPVVRTFLENYQHKNPYKERGY
jgi:8-oxo-dGTP diphosphatase